MNRLLKIALVLIVTLTILPPAGHAKELPKALGITFGAPYEDVLDAYLKTKKYEEFHLSIFEILSPSDNLKVASDHETAWVNKLGSAHYKFPLVELEGAGTTLYIVFDGKVYGCTIYLGYYSDSELKSRFNELQQMISKKYGSPSETKTLFERTTTWLNSDFRIKLYIEAPQIDPSSSKSREKEPSNIVISYTYLPLERAKEEFLKEKKAKEADVF